MEIKRDVYLNRLKIRKHNGFIKVITGIRRSGKSYLLNTIFHNSLLEDGIKEDHIIKFAFDSADDLRLIGENLTEIAEEKRKVDPNKFMDYINSLISDNDMYYLLLDEVQNLGSFESVLNGYLRRSNMDIYVTGSNSKFLSSDIITEFEGRGDEVHVLPLMFSEFFSVYEGSKEEAFDILSKFRLHYINMCDIIQEFDEMFMNSIVPEEGAEYINPEDIDEDEIREEVGSECDCGDECDDCHCEHDHKGDHKHECKCQHKH